MKIRILATLAACMAAGPLHAQNAQRIANFLYVPRSDSATSRDASWTILYATQGRGRPEGGSITWGCREGGVFIAVAAPELSAGQTVRMVYRFDRGEPDTVAATTWSQGNALSLPAALQRQFTHNVLVSERLSVRLVHPGGESERRFDLTGSTRALGILPCVRQLTGGSSSDPAVGEPADSLGPGEYALGDVEELPAMTNLEEVQEALRQNYPAALLRARGDARVMLRVRVRPDGSVHEESIHVVSATNPEAIYPARRVAAVMRFRPARVRGQPVTTVLYIPIHFTMGR